MKLIWNKCYIIPVLIAPESGNALADGRLDIVKVTTAGMAQDGGTTWGQAADRNVVNVPVRGDGTGALATVTIGGTSGSADGTVTACAITSNGSGYTHAYIHHDDII